PRADDRRGAPPGHGRRDAPAAIAHPRSRLAAPAPAMVGRLALLARDLGPYRLHRHRALDRFRTRLCLVLVDQPGASEPPRRDRHPVLAPRRRQPAGGFLAALKPSPAKRRREDLTSTPPAPLSDSPPRARAPGRPLRR